MYVGWVNSRTIVQIKHKLHTPTLEFETFETFETNCSIKNVQNNKNVAFWCMKCSYFYIYSGPQLIILISSRINATVLQHRTELLFEGNLPPNEGIDYYVRFPILDFQGLSSFCTISWNIKYLNNHLLKKVQVFFIPNVRFVQVGPSRIAIKTLISHRAKTVPLNPYMDQQREVTFTKTDCLHFTGTFAI